MALEMWPASLVLFLFGNGGIDFPRLWPPVDWLLLSDEVDEDDIEKMRPYAWNDLDEHIRSLKASPPAPQLAYPYVR